MLILVTGSPGAGKTSNTLWEFLKNPQYQDRPRFCSDITDFDRAAHGIGDFSDMEKWQDLPDGSLVLVDEAQRFLRPRTGRQVPDYIAAFETHRHRGIDFLFITQHPSLIDTHVRRLIGRHHHFHRPFGIKNSIRYTWEFCQENPCAFTYKDAVRKTVRTNPEVFKLYKSTVQDTHKQDLPLGKLALGLFGVLMVIGGLFATFNTFLQKSKKQDVAKQETQTQQQTQQDKDRSLVGFDAPVQQQEKTFKPEHLIPRDKNIPWSAPYYDQLTQPSDFPRIAACISGKSSTNSYYNGCRCFTQQATPVDVDEKMCLDIVKHGTFDNWLSQRQMNQLNANAAAVGAVDVSTTEERKRANSG